MWLAQACFAAPAVSEVGAAIYRDGVLPGGGVLRGEREGGVTVQGQGAACATCHRRSGLGSAEGRISAPPIIGRYLFRAHSTNLQDLSLPHVQGYQSKREPYTAQTLARAIREGVDPGGRQLSFLMPRYALNDAAMKGLTAYLQDLTSQAVPGVTEDTLHFATIIAPDADPVERLGMLEVMNRFFEDKNSFLRGGVRRLQTSREIEYRVSRRWQLHVWELTGTSDTWEAQLQAKLAAEPVFAVISGLAGSTWAPVHQFCEKAGLPCLFPNVPLPVMAESDFYPVYYSRGVLLESDLMLQRLRGGDEGAPTASRLLQVFREDGVGRAAAADLARHAASIGIKSRSQALSAAAGDRSDVAAAMTGLAPGDALVLWLRPDDIAALPPTPPANTLVILSGLLGGLEQTPLPAAWRDVAHMTYPADTPELRKVRMNYPLGWFKIRRIPVVAERVQTDTYVACGILAEALNDMLDSFVRDYLVERIESMLSHRLTNGYYPRLSLAPGQRFASKGGYIVRAAAVGSVQAEGDWIVP